MTIEEKLKDCILSKYKSIRAFTQVADLPYTTIDGILKRGVANASIGNVLRICKALGISADELANSRIVPVSDEAQEKPQSTDLEEALALARINYEPGSLSIDKQEINRDELEVLLTAAEVAVGIIRRQRGKH